MFFGISDVTLLSHSSHNRAISESPRLPEDAPLNAGWAGTSLNLTITPFAVKFGDS